MSISFFEQENMSSDGSFSDYDLAEKGRTIPVLVDLIKKVELKGFTYGGDTRSASKAYTDVGLKKIFIKKDKSLDEACLSLAYELTNAINKEKLEAIHAEYLNDKRKTEERATEYAHHILNIEVEAVLVRSVVAVETSAEKYVKNPKYNLIVKECGACLELAKRTIFKEMIENGKVHNGKIKAVDFYKDQYYRFAASRI